MATVVHDNFRNAQMGTPGGSTTTTDFDADGIDLALLDQTDSGAITASTNNYGEVDTAVVVADRSDSGEIPLGSKTVGVVAVGVFDAADPTFDAISGSCYSGLWRAIDCVQRLHHDDGAASSIL